MIYLYRLSKIYAAFLKILGYERGLGRFIDRLVLAVPDDARILDAACGSGVVGLELLDRLPKATLIATDLQKNFLLETRANAKDRGIAPDRVTVGFADVSEPKKVSLPNGNTLALENQTFDIVCVGGALGYAKDPAQSTRDLLSLLKPGGYFINLEMNLGPVGRFVAWLYSYRPMPIEETRRIAEEQGHSVTVVRFALRDFPANLTRIGIVTQTGAVQAK